MALRPSPTACSASLELRVTWLRRRHPRRARNALRARGALPARPFAQLVLLASGVINQEQRPCIFAPTAWLARLAIRGRRRRLNARNAPLERTAIVEPDACLVLQEGTDPLLGQRNVYIARRASPTQQLGQLAALIALLVVIHTQVICTQALMILVEYVNLANTAISLGSRVATIAPKAKAQLQPGMGQAGLG